MSLETDIKLLSEVPLFDDLAGDQLRLLAFSANRRDLVNGEILFREGEDAGGGYVVVFGTIELFTGSGEERRLMERCGPGCLIGELPLFIATRRRSSASAAGVATVLDISRPAISQHLRVLREAGLVTERREGTRRLYRVRPEGIREVTQALEAFWDGGLSRLKAEAERQERALNQSEQHRSEQA